MWRVKDLHHLVSSRSALWRLLGSLTDSLKGNNLEKDIYNTDTLTRGSNSFSVHLPCLFHTVSMSFIGKCVCVFSPLSLSGWFSLCCCWLPSFFTSSSAWASWRITIWIYIKIYNQRQEYGYTAGPGCRDDQSHPHKSLHVFWPLPFNCWFTWNWNTTGQNWKIPFSVLHQSTAQKIFH